MQENKAGRAFLVTSIILGILAMVLSFAYLQGKTDVDTTPKAKILVAKHDLRANVMLDPEKDLQDFDIPANMEALRQRTIRAVDRDDCKGKRINRDILAGTPLWAGDLVAAATLELPPGKVAMSINAHGSSALSGLLIPGNYVKVLVTRPVVRARTGSEMGSPTQFEAVTVCPEALKVLAVGTSLTRPRMHVTMNQQYDAGLAGDTAQTVTLEVTETQSHTILEQTGAGQFPVTLILCPDSAASAAAPAAPAPAAP